MSIFIIAEVGINHNGSLDIAKKLIDVAVFAGCDAVKFQKRAIDLVYSKEILDTPRKSPWGTTTRQQKEGLEFGLEEYKEIDVYCRQKGIEWFASAWDLESVEFLKKYKEAIDTLEVIKEKLRTAQAVLNELRELKKKEEAEIEEWQNTINDIKEKLTLVDNNLFEI